MSKLLCSPLVIDTVPASQLLTRGHTASPQNQLPSCGWYVARYAADYWGGAPFPSLAMMRDAETHAEIFATSEDLLSHDELFSLWRRSW